MFVPKMQDSGLTRRLQETEQMLLTITKEQVAGAKHMEDAVRGMAGRFDGSNMARHTLEMHLGEEPKFGMIIVRTNTRTFTLAMGEVIRILYSVYRSKEKGMVLLNSKVVDFALPRLSIKNWEDELKAPSESQSRKCHQN